MQAEKVHKEKVSELVQVASAHSEASKSLIALFNDLFSGYPLEVTLGSFVSHLFPLREESFRLSCFCICSELLVLLAFCFLITFYLYCFCRALWGFSPVMPSILALSLSRFLGTLLICFACLCRVASHFYHLLPHPPEWCATNTPAV